MNMKPGKEEMPSVAIVGAGYCGALTAANLLRESRGRFRVLLIEKERQFGRGLAYSTWDDNFLLNVPAGNMSAFADKPEDFVEFCRAIDPAFNEASFISRRIYGDYLEHTLLAAGTNSPSLLQRLSGEVISVRRSPSDDGFILTMADDKTLVANQVVLALGHFAPKPFLAGQTCGTPRNWIDNPWDFESIDRFDSTQPVLLIGTGHTAIDVLFRLTRNAADRKVFMLSRRGLIPCGHRFRPKAPPTTNFPEYLQDVSPTVRSYMRVLRNRIRLVESGGGDWRDAINELRTHTPELWMRLSHRERCRFLRHAVAYWDIHRHRLAPSAYRRLSQMRESGQVKVLAGKILSAAAGESGLTLNIRQRGQTNGETFAFGGVINCSGPNYDIASLDDPLVRQLHDEGFLKQDAMKIGIQFDELYQVLDRDGKAVEKLHYIGPMLKAAFWESIAIPELRVHSQRLASQIVGMNTVSNPLSNPALDHVENLG